MSRNKRQLYADLQGISKDIYKFAEACNFVPHTQQRWVLDAVMRGDEKIGIKSGQGPGKTAVSSLIALWRSIRYVDGLVIYTAPSMRQVKDVAFAEMRQHINRMQPWLKRFFHADAMKITIAGRKDWSIQGVTASKSENAQGYHRDGMTVIAEEASGMPRELMENFEGTLTNHDPLFIQIGNPNTRDCDFFDVFHGAKRDKWTTFTFNTEDTALWHPEILRPKRNQEMLDTYGRESDVYRIRVLGEFPLTDPNTVLPAHLLEIAMDKRHQLKASRQTNIITGTRSKQFGIDLARFGGDECTVFQRSGNAVVDWWYKSRVEPIVAVEQAYKMQHEAEWSNKDCHYVMDATGIGQGVLSDLYDNQKNVTEFHNGARAWNNKDYANKITEAWFQLANKLKSGEGNVYIPRDRQLLHQLSTRQYYTNKKGQLILESKEEYIKRGNDSPDRADGLNYCLYDNVVQSANISTRS